MWLHGHPKHKSLVIVLRTAGGFDPEKDGKLRDARDELKCLGEGGAQGKGNGEGQIVLGRASWIF